MGELKLTVAMENMLVNGLIFGAPVLNGMTYKALRMRGLAHLPSALGARCLTEAGAELAREIALELDAGEISPQTIRVAASELNAPITPDGLALIEALQDRQVAAYERAAERGPGCSPGCGCGA